MSIPYLQPLHEFLRFSYLGNAQCSKSYLHTVLFHAIFAKKPNVFENHGECVKKPFRLALSSRRGGLGLWGRFCWRVTDGSPYDIQPPPTKEETPNKTPKPTFLVFGPLDVSTSLECETFPLLDGPPPTRALGVGSTGTPPWALEGEGGPTGFLVPPPPGRGADGHALGRVPPPWEADEGRSHQKKSNFHPFFCEFSINFPLEPSFDTFPT